MSFSQVNFKGIPVDGDASEMINQLKKKGFTDAPAQYGKSTLVGHFFDRDVVLTIKVNNKNVVQSVMVVFMSYINDFEGMSRSSVIRLYNDLLYSFNNNEKYIGIAWMLTTGSSSEFYNNEIESNANLWYNINTEGIKYHSYYRQLPFKNSNSVHFAITIDENNYDKYYVVLLYENLDNKTFGSDDL